MSMFEGLLALSTCCILHLFLRILMSHSRLHFVVKGQSSGTWQPIHVVAQDDNSWKMHLDNVKVEPHSNLWVYGNCPLAELEWDPGDFKWKHNNRLHHFFNYNTKLGQAIQLQLEGPLHNGWKTLASLTRCFVHSRRVSNVSTCLRRSIYFGFLIF